MRSAVPARNWRLWSISPHSDPPPGKAEGPCWSPDSATALHQSPGDWLDASAGDMKRAIEQETLQALVETGTCGNFGCSGEGDTWYNPPLQKIKLSQLRHLSQALPRNVLPSPEAFCFGVRPQAPDSC